MTKIPATKKMQSVPNSGALWPFYVSEHLTQVPDKPMRSIKYMDKEIINLKKDLARSRVLIRSVKMGRGYFSMLQEESALKKKLQQLQKLKEEERHKFQPAKKMSEIHYGEILLTTYNDEKVKKVGAGVICPFTPAHSCIILPSLPEAHVEPLFRQLCALHWLLEALTIDHTHHIMKPVITCWNPKDPGGSKSTIKKINKDKSMGQRWEHFVTAPKTKKFKIPVLRVTSRKPSRRGSTLSLSRTSGGSSPQSSMVSMNPGSDEPPSVITQATGSKDIEDNESSSTKPDEEPLHINLQKLLEMVREDARRTVMLENGMQRKAPSILSMLRQNKSDSAYKDMQTTRKSSDRSSSSSGESHIQVIQKKSKRYARWATEHAGQRYFDLLSKLPEDLKNFRPAKKILAKLQKFGENLDLRIRPHVLLKVLQDLRIWELCSPDIAVAIEFVREHIIHMSQEDYITWLQNRINVPIRSQSLRA
ncbi:coiled-coil domain-containing protein 60 isoform X4 [Zalophus californianus]|uniref:Coiled-coil domain-containing protein 60 isoform X4 n=1 Tax=Zalophus californianus TaxID=9704 RepID=A0A6J2BPS7_ZALCA|nr:coiled-coil domain-containing protein 60 isoform X4 [Zalophus californianus]